MPTRAEYVEHRLNWLRHVTTCATSLHRGLHIRAASVYLLHFPTVGLYKVGVTVSEPLKRIQANTHDRDPKVVEILPTRHRSCAGAVEAVVLNLTEPWRTFDDPWHSDGYTETWSDNGPRPQLREIAYRINPAI